MCVCELGNDLSAMVLEFLAMVFEVFLERRAMFFLTLGVEPGDLFSRACAHVSAVCVSCAPPQIIFREQISQLPAWHRSRCHITPSREKVMLRHTSPNEMVAHEIVAL